MLLEAMAAGLPVIATQVGGVPEVVEEGKTGFLVPPRDVQRMAEAIVCMVRHPERMNQMGIYARALVRSQFSVEAMMDKIERIYSECGSQIAE